MTRAVLGIIGGSGIYDLPGLEDVHEQRVNTPWGEPSDLLRTASRRLPIVFLPRHDRGHRIPPSEINYRANIDALKRLGVTDLVSFSACGSYKEELSPGTFVLVDDFVDRTSRRESSFFGQGLRRARLVRASGGAAAAGPGRTRGRCRGHRRSARRHRGVHGRPAVLDARRDR